MCRVRSLRNLRCLNIENYYFVASSANPVKGLCRLLNGLEFDSAPSQLEEININGTTGRWFSTDGVVGALRKVLQRTHFSALKKVVITSRVEAKMRGKGRGSSRLGMDVLGRSVETWSNVVFVLNIRA
jgi:hypothetical protein